MGGIDIVAYSSSPFLSGKYIVQCKRYSGSVGEPVLRDLYGVVMSENANKGILITTGAFTSSAYRFAEGKQIELIDGRQLNDLLAEYDLVIEDAADEPFDIHSFIPDFSLSYFDREHYVAAERRALSNPLSSYFTMIEILHDAIYSRISDASLDAEGRPRHDASLYVPLSIPEIKFAASYLEQMIDTVLPSLDLRSSLSRGQYYLLRCMKAECRFFLEDPMGAASIWLDVLNNWKDLKDTTSRIRLLMGALSMYNLYGAREKILPLVLRYSSLFDSYRAERESISKMCRENGWLDTVILEDERTVNNPDEIHYLPLIGFVTDDTGLANCVSFDEPDFLFYWRVLFVDPSDGLVLISSHAMEFIEEGASYGTTAVCHYNGPVTSAPFVISARGIHGNTSGCFLQEAEEAQAEEEIPAGVLNDLAGLLGKMYLTLREMMIDVNHKGDDGMLFGINDGELEDVFMVETLQYMLWVIDAGVGSSDKDACIVSAVLGNQLGPDEMDALISNDFVPCGFGDEKPSASLALARVLGADRSIEMILPLYERIGELLVDVEPLWDEERKGRVDSYCSMLRWSFSGLV